VQICADILRRWDAYAPYQARRGFGTMPDENAIGPKDVEAHPQGRWRATDLKRAIRAAEKSGLTSYRIEIAPDGTIAIIVGGRSEQPANAASSVD
jgi:hypothetical protein